MKQGALIVLSLSLFLTVPSTALASGAGNCHEFGGGGQCAVGSGVSPTDTALTLEAWVCHHTLPNSSQPYIWLQSDLAHHAMLRHQGNGTLDFSLVFESGYESHVSLANAFEVGRWYHVAGTWDGASQRLYLDGRLVASRDAYGNLHPGNRHVLLARHDGYIDEVRIWWCARSADEILGSMFRQLTGSGPDLRHYWKFDETSGYNVHDSAGSVDLYLSGVYPPRWVRSGAFAGSRISLAFDFFDDYIRVAQHSGLPLYNTGANTTYTLCAWVNGVSGEDRCVFAEANSTNANPLFSLGTSVDDFWDFGLRVTIRDDANVTRLDATSTSRVFDSEWHHVAWVDSGGAARLYVDGILDETDFAYARGSLTLDRTCLGAVLGATTSHLFRGSIDEVSLWDRPLNAEEIRTLMCASLNGDENGLVAYWRFEQAGGVTLVDWSPNGNHGTLVNFSEEYWNPTGAFTSWTGCAGTGWAVPYNWSQGTVPNSTTVNVGIPAYSGDSGPVLSANCSCRHLAITPGATVTVNSPYTLTASGNVFSLGTQTGTGQVELASTSTGQALSGSFSNLKLNISGGGASAMAGDLTVNGTLTLSNGPLSLSGRTLTLNGPITIGSGSLSGDSTSTLICGGSGASTDLPGVTLDNLTISRSGGIGLAGDVTIFGTVALTGGDLNLSGHTVTLGPDAMMSETPGNTVKGSSGVITTTRTFAAGDLVGGVNIAGMGAEILTDAALGQTVVSRGHAAQADGDTAGVLRYFDISPANNAGLNATLVFRYDDTELNGNYEPVLALHRSTDGGATWTNEGGVPDGGANTVTLTGIESFSRWSVVGVIAPFTLTPISLTGYRYGASAWGDFDNDGDLDLAMAGNTSTGHATRIYRNDGAGSFVDIGAGLPGVFWCDVAWGDYDNDGDLDLVIAGQTASGRIARIYRNDGGAAFTDIGAGLPGVAYCSVAWGDYDNDGDLDLMLAGSTGSPLARIYRNDDGIGFSEVAAGLPGVIYCGVAWGDYDNDGDLDLALVGNAGYSGSDLAHVYRNDSAGIFTLAASVGGVTRSAVAWGDYDNDGDLDLLVSASGEVYRNDGADTFTDIDAGLPGVLGGDAAWGDYDNDGDLDILLVGQESGTKVARLFRNGGFDSFDEVAAFTGLGDASLAWGDYDNDGDLDFVISGYASGRVTEIYRNDTPTANTAPTAPSGLTEATAAGEVHLSWASAGDGQTPQPGLTHNLRMGTAPGAIDVISPMAKLSDGCRRIPGLGNANHSTSWVIGGLPTGTYYWSVQAVDHGFAGSAFAAERSFQVSSIGITTDSVTAITATTATCGGEVTDEGGHAVTAKGIVWDTSPDPTVASHLGMTDDGSGVGAFVSSMTGLAAGQIYFTRAYATNAVTTGYGQIRAFAATLTPPGRSVELDGIDDYVRLDQRAGLPIYNNGTGNAYTIAMWVKAGPQDDRRIFAEGYNAYFNPIFALGTQSAGGDKLRVFIRDNGGTVRLDAVSTYSVFDDTWHHVAWVDNNGAATLYVDGQPDATSFAYTRGSLMLDRTCIGALLRATPSSFLAGRIDEVRIWDVARTAEEIRADMHTVLAGDEAGLVASYRFDQVAGTMVVDQTFNANHGTLVNMDDSDWVLSTASVGHESHVGLGTNNLVEDAQVPVDLTWDADPGSSAIFAAMRVNDVPDVLVGLPAYYDSTYWELWIAHDDGTWQADAAFHYDDLDGITDETLLVLYTRTDPGQGWSLVSSATVNTEGNATDGVGSITAANLTGFSQFMIGWIEPMVLTGSVQLDALTLDWSPVPSAPSYWIYGAANEPHFVPQLESPYGYRVAVTADTTWSSAAGIADPTTDWTYQVIAVDPSWQQLGRSNRLGEHEFALP